MWPAVVSPRHCHVHGGGEGIMVVHARRRHPRHDPPCCIQYTVLLLLWPRCAAPAACMQACVCRIALSMIILSCSMCRGPARTHARTRTHAAVALRGNRCSLLLPSSASVEAWPPITTAGRQWHCVERSASTLVCLPCRRTRKTGLLALRLPYCAFR